jgi:hypothetical protein
MGRITATDIGKETLPLSNDFEQTPPGGEILGMLLEMVGELHHPIGEEGNLHIRRTRIGGVDTEGIDNFLFTLL